VRDESCGEHRLIFYNGKSWNYDVRFKISYLPCIVHFTDSAPWYLLRHLYLPEHSREALFPTLSSYLPRSMHLRNSVLWYLLRHSYLLEHNREA